MNYAEVMRRISYASIVGLLTAFPKNVYG
jgi:hypothetical protein